MPGSTPIREGFLQNDIDLNTQAINNFAVARKYDLAEVTQATYVLSNSDINKLINFSYAGRVDISIPSTVAAAIGNEILLFCSNASGYIVFTPGFGVTLLDAPLAGNVVLPSYRLVRLLCVGANEWITLGNYPNRGNDTLLRSYRFTGLTCCDHTVGFYQPSTSIDTEILAYSDILQNNLAVVEMAVYGGNTYSIADGVVAPGNCSETETSFSNAVVFYTSGAVPVTVYGAGLPASPTDIPAVTSKRWRKANGVYYACDTSEMYVNTTLYGAYDPMYAGLEFPYCFNGDTVVAGACV